MFKKKKRLFDRKRVHDLEEANVSDPNEFWKHITSLGPKGKASIPWEIVDDSGNIVTDKTCILDKWKLFWKIFVGY